MAIRIFCVRIGDKYGPEYEDYINSKLPNVTWIREEFIGRLQWNKLIPMSMDLDEPIVVLDIDMLFVNDYMDAINYPIQQGEFLSMRSWWNDKPGLQGGFQKYYPKDCKYIYDKFIKDPEYWQQYYIKNGSTIGPVNGEQFFIQDTVNEKLDLKYLPESWYTRWKEDADYDWIVNENTRYPGGWLYLGGLNPDIRIVHFLDRRDQCAVNLKAQEQKLISAF